MGRADLSEPTVGVCDPITALLCLKNQGAFEFVLFFPFSLLFQLFWRIIWTSLCFQVCAPHLLKVRLNSYTNSINLIYKIKSTSTYSVIIIKIKNFVQESKYIILYLLI